MTRQLSSLAKKRLKYQPEMAKVLKDVKKTTVKSKNLKTKLCNKVKPYFPQLFNLPLLEIVEAKAKKLKKNEKKVEPKRLRVGVVFSGGQAPGGHNVIAGLFDSLKSLHIDSELIGFLNGPSGIVDAKFKKITESGLKQYRNQGGFDYLGSGRTKIETQSQLKASYETAKELDLDAIVVIGGDDSNTNAAVMAEYFLKKKSNTKVIGVPKTIDGDLKGDYIEKSFGFDTATKVYSEMIGNIAIDALSAKKYYHFIKLMGRSASHVTLECAINTQVNITLIAEEVLDKKLSLKEVAEDIAKKIEKRAKKGKFYGLVLIPEGLIEFIPEVKNLIFELNNILSQKKVVRQIEKAELLTEKVELIEKALKPKSRSCFKTLPSLIQEQLLLDRDPHGNVQVSKIETEKLLIELAGKILSEKKIKFKAQAHFFGYEGRSAFPTNFDSNYCYSLGTVATVLIKEGLTGYMASLKNLDMKPSSWQPLGVPITSMMNIEIRNGKPKPVIRKALVEMNSKEFRTFSKGRQLKENEDLYINPGPIQF